VAVQHQVKKMPPPSSVPQMRTSLNGGMHSVPIVSALQATLNAQVTVPHAVAVMQHPMPSMMNGVGQATMNMPHVDALKLDNHVNSALINGVSTVSPQSDMTGQTIQWLAERWKFDWDDYAAHYALCDERCWSGRNEHATC
jgi:enhancer of polycomb-like protein